MIKKSNFKIKTKIGCLGKQFHSITNFIKLTLYFEYEYSIYDQFLIRNTLSYFIPTTSIIYYYLKFNHSLPFNLESNSKTVEILLEAYWLKSFPNFVCLVLNETFLLWSPWTLKWFSRRKELKNLIDKSLKIYGAFNNY